MSIKYLNLSGLEDLWINIKNYILSKVPTKTSELINDSGYLTSHQSLDNYVTLNTTQTITAIKVITGGNQGKMLFKNPNYTKGDAVESGTIISRLYFGNGTSYGAANGILTFDINSSGNTSLELAALNNTASNSNRASLIITYDKSATRPRLLKSWGDFIPNSNDGYSLGNASNIWKECYSNVYYLGSTAFGDIVTHNASEFLTSHQSLTDYVKFTDCTSDSMTAVWGKVLRVDARSGLTEIGKYIDFHAIADDTIDYAVRLEAVNASSPANGNGSLKISATSGVLPSANNKIPLGTSSLRWKECYSNAYYLGTTAFGDIVTHNASEFLTSHQSLSSCVKNVVTNSQSIKSTAITRGTAPSSTQTFGIPFNDNNDKRIGNIYGQYATDKSTYVGLYAYKGTTTSNSDNVSVRVGYDASGNAYTYAPTPATTDNSTKIATTAFVKAQGYLTSHQSLANYVTTNTDQDIEGNKNFKGLLTTIPNGTLWTITNKTTDDITFLGENVIHIERRSSGNLTDLSNGSWSVVELGLGCFFFRVNNGTDIRYKNFAQNTVNRIPVVSGANRFINDVTPNANDTYSLGTSSLQWKNAYIKNLNLNGNAFDPTSIDGVGTVKLLAYLPTSSQEYTMNAGTIKAGSNLGEVWAAYSTESTPSMLWECNMTKTQSGTWKLLNFVSVGGNPVNCRVIGLWVRIA